jgi:hypothetical protein
MLTPEDLAVLGRVRSAFEACPRPEHFTAFEHCGECAEHDATLLARDPDTLKIEDVGNPGWEPICFTAPEGFAYYLPGLARLVFDDPPYGYSWYGCQFLWLLISDGPSNSRYLHCTPDQRRAIAELVNYLIETRAEKLEAECVAEDAIRAYRIWNGDEAA